MLARSVRLDFLVVVVVACLAEELPLLLDCSGCKNNQITKRDSSIKENGTTFSDTEDDAFFDFEDNLDLWFDDLDDFAILLLFARQ